MKWSKPLLMHSGLRDVRLLTQVPAREWTAHVREREDEAYRRGRLEGDTACELKLVQQRQELDALQNGVMKNLQSILPQVLKEAEPALIQLALEAARKLVAGMPVDAAMVEAVVREALAQVEDSGEITIQLHPDDLALLHKHASPLLEAHAGRGSSGAVKFSSSREAQRGDCLALTRFGTLDARRETKLEQIQTSLNL